MSAFGGTSFGPSGGGTSLGSQSGSSIPFSEIQLGDTLVADATAVPADTPTTNIWRIHRDASGLRVAWHYSTAAATWRGVELGDVI